MPRQPRVANWQCGECKVDVFDHDLFVLHICRNSCKEVRTCPMEECNYVTSVPGGLKEHLSKRHPGTLSKVLRAAPYEADLGTNFMSETETQKRVEEEPAETEPAKMKLASTVPVEDMSAINDPTEEQPVTTEAAHNTAASGESKVDDVIPGQDKKPAKNVPPSRNCKPTRSPMAPLPRRKGKSKGKAVAAFTKVAAKDQSNNAPAEVEVSAPVVTRVTRTAAAKRKLEEEAPLEEVPTKAKRARKAGPSTTVITETTTRTSKKTKTTTKVTKESEKKTTTVSATKGKKAVQPAPTIIISAAQPSKPRLILRGPRAPEPTVKANSKRKRKTADKEDAEAPPAKQARVDVKGKGKAAPAKVPTTTKAKRATKAEPKKAVSKKAAPKKKAPAKTKRGKASAPAEPVEQDVDEDPSVTEVEESVQKAVADGKIPFKAALKMRWLKQMQEAGPSQA